MSASLRKRPKCCVAAKRKCPSLGPFSIRKFQRARIEITTLRQIRPTVRSSPETDVAVINATRQRILLRGVRQHFATCLPERLEEGVIELPDFDRGILAELLQGFGVVGIELRQRECVLRIRSRRYRVTIVGAQALPQLLVNAQGDGTAWLMKPRIVIELRDLVQPQSHGVPWTDPFAGVDGARFQRSRDLAGRQVDDDSA